MKPFTYSLDIRDFYTVDAAISEVDVTLSLVVLKIDQRYVSLILAVNNGIRESSSLISVGRDIGTTT